MRLYCTRITKAIMLDKVLILRGVNMFLRRFKLSSKTLSIEVVNKLREFDCKI